MQKGSFSSSTAKVLKADLALIDGGFVEYLGGRQCAVATIAIYRRILATVACAFSKSRRNLASLRREDVPAIIRAHYRRCVGPARAALHGWLKFRGRFHLPNRHLRWKSWLDAYVSFLENSRALSPDVCGNYCIFADRYMAWQFRTGAVDWRRVRPQHIWRYAALLRSRGHKASTTSGELSALRQFLKFVHLRGGCSAVLPQAVPIIADRGQSLVRSVITDKQQLRLLASFDRQTPEGRRDYTMTLCMSDLGLRRIEVARLCVGDVDLARNTLTVPPAKNAPGRQLPIPPHVAAALRIYLQRRPVTKSDRLFVGHTYLIGRPLSALAIQSAVERAYQRCGFRFHGTHRLRRRFATRLFARGANLKEIADLLGHRVATTTERYAQVYVYSFRVMTVGRS
jgi:site-specific recombinase XerD